MDGTYGSDTSERLDAGRRLWFWLRRKLPRLGVSLRIRARVAQATVCAALLYGAETRPSSATEARRYRVFVNCVFRGLVCTPKTKRGTLRDMEGKETNADRRVALGLDDVEVLIVSRQLGHIGHLALYTVDRMERFVLGLISVSPGGDTSFLATSVGVRAMMCSRVLEVFQVLWLDPVRAPESWVTVASERALWRKATKHEVEKYRAKANADTWQNRHHGKLSHNDLIANTSLQTLGAASRAQCLKCGV